ncbi:SIMPL domain-containing protein [Pontibacillus salicampi]|uniref:SIMPL domain-containing protein n=1 Tax=Pontibacillus salicampi TaxID=1449801 RepID=A0ABV6LMX4_9BACI
MYYPPNPPFPNRPLARSSNARVMTVNGIGSVTASPDIANIEMGVVTRGEELAQTQRENAKLIAQVTQALLDSGIEQSNIQTSDYYIYPQYDYVDGQQEFKGYQVTHMLSITIDNLEQTGQIIDTAVQNGVNRVANIQFTIQHPEDLYEEALSKALENALSKAQTMAQTMNLQLDISPLSITERVTQSPGAYQTLAKSEAVAGAATQVEPGQLSINAQVEVKFPYV